MNLSFLLYLACPIGMGVMMWMMMRGNRSPQNQNSQPAQSADLPSLRAQLDSLETQQHAIRLQMQRLDDEDAIELSGAGKAPTPGLEALGSKRAV